VYHATGSTPLFVTASIAHRSIEALQRSIKQDQGRLRLCQKYVASSAVQGTAKKTITSRIVSHTPSRRSLAAAVAGHGLPSAGGIMKDKEKIRLILHTRIFFILRVFIKE